jgi:hypothetical protein
LEGFRRSAMQEFSITSPLHRLSCLH